MSQGLGEPNTRQPARAASQDGQARRPRPPARTNAIPSPTPSYFDESGAWPHSVEAIGSPMCRFALQRLKLPPDGFRAPILRSIRDVAAAGIIFHPPERGARRLLKQPRLPPDRALGAGESPTEGIVGRASSLRSLPSKHSAQGCAGKVVTGLESAAGRRILQVATHARSASVRRVRSPA